MVVVKYKKHAIGDKATRKYLITRVNIVTSSVGGGRLFKGVKKMSVLEVVGS